MFAPKTSRTEIANVKGKHLHLMLMTFNHTTQSHRVRSLEYVYIRVGVFCSSLSLIYYFLSVLNVRLLVSIYQSNCWSRSFSPFTYLACFAHKYYGNVVMAITNAPDLNLSPIRESLCRVHFITCQMIDLNRSYPSNRNRATEIAIRS